MAPAEDGPEPRAAQVDDPPPFVKGIKGRKDMHVPKAVWRQHRPRTPRAMKRKCRNSVSRAVSKHSHPFPHTPAFGKRQTRWTARVDARARETRGV